MPTYSYRCRDCSTAFDIQQAFTDDSLSECPSCGGSLRKLFNAVGVSFNGSGFYRNDSRAAANSAAASSEKKLEKSEKKSEKKDQTTSAPASASSAAAAPSSSPASTSTAKEK